MRKSGEKKRQITIGLASVGVSVREQLSDNLEAHRPSQP